MNINAESFPRRHRISVEDYHRMGKAGIFSEDDRVELIEGEVIDMAPIGSKHSACVTQLNRIFVQGTDALVRVQDPIRLPGPSEPQPDISIVKSQKDRYASAHPGPKDILLLIEVADTSLDYDRSVKVPLYARHGIPEVWLVDLESRTVEVFREPSTEGYRSLQRHGAGERLSPLALPEIDVDLTEVLGWP